MGAVSILVPRYFLVCDTKLTERVGVDFEADNREGTVEGSLSGKLSGRGDSRAVELAGRDDTDVTEDGVRVSAVGGTSDDTGVTVGVGDAGEGEGVGVEEADVGSVTDGVEISEIDVVSDTSRDPEIVGRRNEVSNDVSRGSGIAIDCAEEEAARIDES